MPKDREGFINNLDSNLKRAGRSLGELLGVKPKNLRRPQPTNSRSVELTMTLGLTRNSTTTNEAEEALKRRLALTLGVNIEVVDLSFKGIEIASADPNAAVRKLNEDRLAVDEVTINRIMGESE